jgi:hypothetical protein
MISILMPVYNCPPDLLEKALVSVFKQTHTDWEIIIKDGCTEKPAVLDNSICAILEDHEDKINYILSPESADRANRQNSYYEALNWCIEHSTGDILTVLAGDDERGGPFVLEHVQDEFEKHGPSPLCLYGVCEWVNHAGEHLAYKQPPRLPVTFDVILNDFPFYTPAVFWNRAVHTRFGLYDTQYPWCADLDFWLKTWRGIDSAFTPEVIGKYRHWEISQQRDNGDLAGQEGTRILEKWRALR